MITFLLQVERPGHLCSRVGRGLSRRNERRFNRQLLRFGARSLQEIRSKSARLWQKTTCETDPDLFGNAVICGVLGQCRCQSAWMGGATLCSWLFVCECAPVQLYTKSQRFRPFMIRTQMFFFTKETFSHATERTKLEGKATS